MYRARRSLTTVAVLLTACGGQVLDPALPIEAKKDPGTKPKYSFDAEQPAVATDRNPLAIYPTVIDRTVVNPFSQNLAQTFTPTVTAELHFLFLPVACVTDVLLRLQLAKGSPDGPVIWDRNYDPGHAYADGTWVALQIYGGLNLMAGEAIAIILSTTPRPGAAGTTCSIIPGPVGDAYAGGQGFYNNPGFPANYWIPLPDGAPTSNEDLPFRTLVR